MKIGVFVCHCGLNIAETVDVKRVAEEISQIPGVVVSTDYTYMCSDPGQNLIQKSIREKNLDAVVVAACSPSMHEETFRKAAAQVGLNPYRVEIANIREQCSWVHSDREAATEKAIRIIKSVIEKVKLDEPLQPIKVGVNKKCLVIGGGISGIQAALDVADSGYEVILVEKSPTIGGHMAQLSETFPTLDCAQCILTPKMVAVSRHPKIKILTLSEVIDVSGFVGNFHVKILKKPRFVIEDKCTLCGECEKVCPQVLPNEFDRNLSPRKAIYLPFPQAVPAAYLIDMEHCLGINPLICGKCKDVCDAEAIDYDMNPEIIEEDVGAIIVATGYDLYPKEKIAEYGYGKYPDVIDSLQFERLLSASGPTGGVIRRPSDGKIPKNVVFIQCVGSRDPENHLPYCSKICCMYTAKHAKLYKHTVPDGNAYVFYMDIRAAGRGYEEFIQNVMEHDKVIYIRGRVSKVYQEGDKLKVMGVDTLLNRAITIDADLVVLAMAIVPSKGTQELARILKVPVDQYGFIKEAHAKLKPVETVTSGIYAAGTTLAPKDIPDTVSQGSGAGIKAVSLLSKDELLHEPTTVKINEETCSRCGVCVSVCPYNALTLREDHVDVNPILCEGCGTCVAACPSGSLSLRNLVDAQIENMIKVALEE
ncbi:MAG: CoB--CoM heterodisulfide reductase iron-sulfur subunit A family protein [Candidatus Odinarchaeota archaeon]|nr:CoB--CoM heterodisulfide reductase iron-sulfur subunit A family protein [Candidatus Odinarchaeota archaeon]